MTSNLITGISELVTNDDELAGADHSEGLGLVPEAAVIVEDDQVLWVGPAAGAPEADRRVEYGQPREESSPRRNGAAARR